MSVGAHAARQHHVSGVKERSSPNHPPKSPAQLLKLELTKIAVKDRSRRDDAPAGPDSRTGGVANEQIIVEVPNRCVACARIVKQIVGSAVAIEIG
jgi:hypothetical protein